MTDDKAFVRLHPDDKLALKRFMTGQIQNVLANEYGIGGSKGLKGEITRTIREEVASQLRSINDVEHFAERVADALLRKYRGDRGLARKEVEKAIRDAAKEAIADVVGMASKQISVAFSIKEEREKVSDQNPNFGRF